MVLVLVVMACTSKVREIREKWGGLVWPRSTRIRIQSMGLGMGESCVEVLVAWGYVHGTIED